jgi:uncharacterized protein (TIGR03067 family)
MAAVAPALVIALGCLLVAAREATAQESKSRAGQSDAQRIRGHWVAVKYREDGKSEDPAGACQLVFTDKEVKFSGKKGGVARTYHLDPDKTPKQIDLNLLPKEAALGAFAGIYRFDGERLWLCLATGTDQPRPDSFRSKAGDKRQLLLLERGKPNPQGIPSYLPEGFHPADQALSAELRQRIVQAAALIDTNRFGEFMAEFLAPAEFEKILGETHKTRHQFIRDVKKAPYPGFLLLLRAARNKVPAVNAAGTEALFDLRDTHANGTPARPDMAFSKIDGKWYLHN